MSALLLATANRQQIGETAGRGRFVAPITLPALAVFLTRDLGSHMFPHITQSRTPNGANPSSQLDALEIQFTHSLAFKRSSQTLDLPGSPRTSRWHGHRRSDRVTRVLRFPRRRAFFGSQRETGNRVRNGFLSRASVGRQD